MTTNSTSPEHILQVGLGFWASKTLLSAVEMGVFTELSSKPEDLETLRGRLGLHPRAARDFLDALAALGFLCRVDDSTGPLLTWAPPRVIWLCKSRLPIHTWAGSGSILPRLGRFSRNT